MCELVVLVAYVCTRASTQCELSQISSDTFGPISINLYRKSILVSRPWCNEKHGENDLLELHISTYEVWMWWIDCKIVPNSMRTKERNECDFNWKNLKKCEKCKLRIWTCLHFHLFKLYGFQDLLRLSARIWFDYTQPVSTTRCNTFGFKYF